MGEEGFERFFRGGDHLFSEKVATFLKIVKTGDPKEDGYNYGTTPQQIQTSYTSQQDKIGT